MDEFLTTMNRAAEQAVPEAAAVLADAVRQLTLSEAKAILRGTNSAATDYFRRSSETNLHARFLPLVKKATESAGVTGAYKQLIGRAGIAGGATRGGLTAGLFRQDDLDLDAYVTRKATDGLFVKIAEEEKRLRENPASRSTDLLRKVFGAVP